jgi:UDP-GlcNAc:undecaprenyl-phosphate GlcNAc-1-phosphate transferase
MLWACLTLLAASAALAIPLCAILIRIGHRMGTFDSAGVAGQVKVASRRVPNTGGVAVFWSITLPMACGLLAIGVGGGGATGASGWLAERFPGLAVHLPGIAERSGEAFILLSAMLVIHVLGLIDDRRPMRALPKLLIMACVAAGLSIFTQTRVLTSLDGYVGGPWLSYAITIVWIIAITNAMNFLDNMDGLSAGVGLIASVFFLIGTLASPAPQWFIAAMLAMLIGGLGGFLCFNAPRPWTDRKATLFLGDGGSLVVGLVLSFLTARTTYFSETTASGDVAMLGTSYSVFTPIIVLAVPLYDFTTVVLLRLSQGKSPFVGDLQHVSHRLVERGFTRRGAVYLLWAFTAATACGAVTLPLQNSDFAGRAVVIQTLIMLCVLGALERGSRHARQGEVKR